MLTCSPARLATPHTDISTEFGLMTGRPVRLAIVCRMKLFLTDKLLAM